MADTVRELLEKAAKLDAEERHELVDRLIDVDTLGQADWDTAWGREACRRLEQLPIDPEQVIEAADVLAEGRRRAAARRAK